MTKRPVLQAFAVDPNASPNCLTKADTLVAIVDHCTAAQNLADKIGNRFLSYLLAMTIQESRSSLRPGDEELALRSIFDAVPDK